MREIITIDPSTGAKLETYAYTTAHDVDAKLDSAKACRRQWGALALAERAKVLRAAATRLRARQLALATTATREMGKPLTQALAEVEKCAWCCEYYADRAHEYLADETVHTTASRSYVGFRPLGTVLAVMPWNFPYWQVFRAAAPALMAGNTMVLKHASNVTRCAIDIEAIFRESGAPDGLFTTLILGSEDVAGVIADRRISAVTLTGSEGAGMSVAAAAGRALKKTVLELGGSDAFIVLADADLEAAIETAVKARFQNNGQSCIAAKRFIIERAVYDAFVSGFAKAAGAQRLGDPMDAGTELGPLARGDLRDALHEQVTSSVSGGARVATGGKPVDRPGFFYEPTVLADVTPEMAAFREETFGPVAACTLADDAEHAVALANDSDFGLGGNLWTRDIGRAAELAARIESGNVFINGMTASDPRLPFGGIKRSGYGRELSGYGIREFVNVQTVWIA